VPDLCYSLHGDEMVIKYDKLFVLMREKGLSTYRIRQDKIIGQATLQKLKNNEPVNTDTIDALCFVLDCQPGDIMEFEKEGDS